MMNSRFGTASDTRSSLDRRADLYLLKIQEQLPPEDAKKVVAINLEIGEFVLAETIGEALTQYREKWPNVLYYLVRADGEPLYKLRTPFRRRSG
jgi:hypothetical protein